MKWKYPFVWQLAGKTIFVTGASRGIGKAIALKAAADGANVVIAAKTAEPHPRLPGTIYTAAKEIESVGGKCLPCIVDVRFEDQVQAAVDAAVKTFGGIDILVNNASAINLAGTLDTSMKTFDLMHQVNARGTFLTSKLCLPYLKKGKNPHIINVAPAINLSPAWLAGHVAYSMSKYGMTMCALSMSEEFKTDGVAVNALWPKTVVWSAAVNYAFRKNPEIRWRNGKDRLDDMRFPEIMADAAYAIMTSPSRSYTGNIVMDEDVLRQAGLTNFDAYGVKTGAPRHPDPYLDEFLAYAAKSSPPQSNDPTRSDHKSQIERVFDALRARTSEELVKRINAIFVFEVGGEGTWYLDLKNGAGTAGKGPSPTPPDVSFLMDGPDLVRMFKGELKVSVAFVTGKLKIRGDMDKATKLLDKLMGVVQSKL